MRETPLMVERCRPLALLLVLAIVFSTAAAAPSAAEPVGTVHSSPAGVLREVLPRAGGVVPAGPVTLSVTVPAGAVAHAQLTLDGREVSTDVVDSAEGTVVVGGDVVAHGSHVASITVELTTGARDRRLWRFAASGLSVRRISGEDRITTAVAAAQATHPDGQAPAAVIARADDFADALAGAPLAAALSAPLLLNGSGELHPANRSALQTLLSAGASVHLLGGHAALSAELEKDLRAAGYEVARHAGVDRYATSVAVAEQVVTRSETSTARAVLVSGEDFPDALAAAVPAASAGWPLLLTRAEDLPEATATWLRDSGIERLEVVGGGAAISSTVIDAVPPAVSARRTGGASRYETAALVAQRLRPEGAGGTVVLASGSQHADALTGAVLGAGIDAPLLLSDTRLPPATAAALVQRDARSVTVMGGTAAVSERVLADLHRTFFDGVMSAVDMAPPAGTVLTGAPDPQTPTVITLRVPGQPLDERTQATVLLDGREALMASELREDSLTISVMGLPDGTTLDDDSVLTLIAGLSGTAATVHVERDLVLRPAPEIKTPEGFLARAGAGALAGRSGTLRTYSLEVEPGVGVDLLAFSREAEAALSDQRGWAAAGGWRLQRVEPGAATARVVLARPATVDRYCAQAGLRTAGIYSCWNGRLAMINLDRWNTGAAGFAGPLDDYRRYVINHEVGHALGYGHRGCPAPGGLAPVMMQQTKGTGACLPNPWPYP